jgi:predicted transcriptional regulator
MFALLRHHFEEKRTMRIKAIVAAVLFAAIGAKAQAPTQEQINQAVTAQHDFFDSKTNQTLSRCSDEAWALMRYEGELTLLGKKGPQTTAQEVRDKQSTIDKCKGQASKGYDDLWSAIASMLKMQEQGGDLVHEIREQLRYLETLGYVRTLAGGASEKILRDHLYDSHDRLQARYDKLVARYNALADSLAAVPLPSNYERPRRLHCETTSNHLGEWSTITTDCQ